MHAFPVYGRNHLLILRRTVLRCGKSRLFRVHIMRVSYSRLQKQDGCEVCNFDFGNESEKISCFPALTPSSLNTQPCEPISWIQATNFSRTLALTTSCGVSDTRPTLFLHASRPYGTTQICWARLCKPGDASSATARLHRRATNPGLLRAPRPLAETLSSKLTLLRRCNCARVTRQQPPTCRDIPTLLKTCHRTTEATLSQYCPPPIPVSTLPRATSQGLVLLLA